MLDTVKINHVQHISFTQSRLTDAVSVILSELLSYEHPSNCAGLFALIRRLMAGLHYKCSQSIKGQNKAKIRFRAAKKP